MIKTIIGPSPAVLPRYDHVWRDVPMPLDYTCSCGLYVHPARKMPGAVHVADCLYAEPPKSEPTGIPHDDLIRAVLDGKVVQRRNLDFPSIWYDADLVEIVNNPNWTFRLKPEPVVRWSAIYKAMRSVSGLYVDRDNCIAEFPGLDLLLRIELDPDTLAVISAHTEAP